ncbi:MAG: hypothetical protein IIX69_08000, partial [Clostridia bacterium]|nr:hypothetical protein [Clostridia bacterium]
MKILFFGDSITDAGRNRDNPNMQSGLGYGYVRVIADRLLGEKPDSHTIINTGISGNRIVDLYARIKTGVWQHEPELISILIGINDIWHEITHKNGVDNTAIISFPANIMAAVLIAGILSSFLRLRPNTERSIPGKGSQASLGT